MEVSLIIPVYNESKSLLFLFKELLEIKFGFDYEIIFIDDGSTDSSYEMLKNFSKNHVKIKILRNSKNKGKGFSLRKGIRKSKGELIFFHDADLEYNLENFSKIYELFGKKEIQVVYGSRFIKTKNKGNFFFYLGNKFLSFVTSFLFFQKITDMETGCKCFRKKVLKSLNLKSNGFEIEPEITSKILSKNIKIYEIPINYFPRKKKEGKKISIFDGFVALEKLIQYKFF